MPETGFRPLPREGRGSFATMAATGREGVRVVRARPLLLAILGVAALGGMWSESYDRLWQAHLILDVGLPELGGVDPVVWFGILGVAGMVLSILVAVPLGRRLGAASRATLVRWLLALDCVLAGASLVFALAGELWLAIGASCAIVVTRELAGPLLTIWLNRSIGDSGVRATVLSITNQADAIGQWTGGPAIGALGSVVSIRVALAAAAGCLLAALPLYRRALRIEKLEASAAETAVEPVV
jgi:hypothetical protein